MSQSSVTVSINGKDYPMACSVGQEGHVMALGQRIDQVVRGVSSASGPIAESRLLVMAALILTDRLIEAEKKGDGSAADGKAAADNAGEGAAAAGAAGAGGDDAELAALINSLAARLEKLA